MASVAPVRRWTPSASYAAARFHTCRSLREEQQEASEEVLDPKHQMLIGFTCNVCSERSHHVMSKLAYTKGVVLIECPGCKNRHLIADNLGWFRDQKTTVEDIIQERGEAIRKIVVDAKGGEHNKDIMEWLPELSEIERAKKEEAKQAAEELRRTEQEQDQEQEQEQEQKQQQGQEQNQGHVQEPIRKD